MRTKAFQEPSMLFSAAFVNDAGKSNVLRLVPIVPAISLPPYT